MPPNTKSLPQPNLAHTASSAGIKIRCASGADWSAEGCNPYVSYVGGETAAVITAATNKHFKAGLVEWGLLGSGRDAFRRLTSDESESILMAMRGAQDAPRGRGFRCGVSEALVLASAHPASEADGITRSLDTKPPLAEVGGQDRFVNWRGEPEAGHLGLPALTQMSSAEDDLVDVRRLIAALGEGPVA